MKRLDDRIRHIMGSLALVLIIISGCDKAEFLQTAKDNLAPEVISVSPANNMTSIPLNSKATVSFSEEIDPATVNSESFFIKKGTSSVSGSVVCNDSIAVFTPSQSFESGTLYTVTVTSSVKDISGNAISRNYSWSFTTAALADITPPHVVSVSPVSNAAGIAPDIALDVIFSEVMNPASLTSLSFVLKQGSVTVPGSITLTGSTARFTPSVQLTGSTTYTATITKGVQDISGNPMISDYSWSFVTATAAASSGKSFSADVVPVLNLCNTCHTHGWSPSSNASTFHANLVNGGYISTTSPTTGKIYKKLSGSHPSGSTVTSAQKTTIMTWITEGSKNN